MTAPAAVDPKVWRRLIKEARRACEAPDLPQTALERAEKAARRATVIGVLSDENPCVRLVRASRQFVAARARNRRALTPGLLGALAHVEQLLPPPGCSADPDPPRLPYRADIEG